MSGFPKPDVLVIATSPRRDSVSSRAATAVASRLDAEGFVVSGWDMRDLPLVPAGLELSKYPGEVRALVEAAESAVGVVLAAPVHQSAVAGLARNAAELLRAGIEGKVALVIVAAGSQRSTLAANAFRADLIVNFGCDVTQAVLLSPDVPTEEVDDRLEAAVEEFTSALRQCALKLGRSAALR